MKHLPLLALTTLLLSSLTGCINHGSYRYGGAFPNVQLPAEGKTIGMLDPRGAYGDERARDLLQSMVKKAFGKCPGTVLLTEDELNAKAQLPAIFGDQLSDGNLDWFVENTELDYLVVADVGPGSFEKGPISPVAVLADRQASTVITVYDLADGGPLKSIAVTGSLLLDPDGKIWELEASETSIGYRSLRKGLKRLGKYSDCR